MAARAQAAPRVAAIVPARGEDPLPAGNAWIVAALTAFALILGAYFSFRYAGRWADSDTAVMASAIRAIIRNETLVPVADEIYPNGYLFSLVSAALVATTGLSVQTLLQALYPLISASLVLVAWPVYRELTGSSRAATIATVLLVTQPEFLFVVLRGSHERVLRALLFVAIWLLVRSFRAQSAPTKQAVYILLFYLSVYGVIATNSLFGSSFIWAMSVALIGSMIAALFGPGLGSVAATTRQRLIYAPLFCALLAYLFSNYLYPPAGHAINQVPDLFDRLSRLFLTVSQEDSAATSDIVEYDPYATIFQQWIDPRIYLLLSIGTYVLMLTSAIAWGRLGLIWLARPRSAPTVGQWLLWLFYGAFAAQGFLSIIADRSGSFGGNLQYRSFPSFVMVAAPVVAIFLAQWRPTRSLRILAAGALGMLTLFAVAKATNEPILSNKWTFYVPAEEAVMRFANSHLSDRSFWSDLDERLFTAHVVMSGQYVFQHTGQFSPGIRTYAVTDIVRLRAARTGQVLPPVSGELRVYDNGEAQVYRLRPRTPYQR